MQNDHSAHYAGYVIALLALVNVCNYMDRMALAVLSPLIKVDLALSDAQLGLLVGVAFSLFYAICGIPIARLADRASRRNIIMGAITVWSVMTALCGAANQFWQLFLTRMGVGAGEAGAGSPSVSIACDYVPLQRRPGALAVLAFGNYAGILVGMALAGWLGERVGWRWTFVILAVPGILLALVVRMSLREPVRGALDITGPSRFHQPSLAATLHVLWRCRTYRMTVLFLIANGFVQYGLNQWWPSFYARTFGLSLSQIGLYLGVALGVSAGTGVLIGGALANRVARRSMQRPLIIGVVATGLALPTAWGSLFISSFGGSIALVALTGFFWGVSNGPLLAAQYSVVNAQIRATAGSIAIFLTAVFGFGLGPYVVGLLSDVLAPSLREDSLRYALMAPVMLTVVMMVALLKAARTLPDDLRIARSVAAA